MSSLSGDDAIRILWETQVLRYHGVGALCFLLWEYIITFGDEVKYIWPQNRRSPTKWVFLFTRYFGLLAQARLVSVSLTLPLDTPSVEDCRIVYTTQVVCGGILMACIQGVLMLRVYALYIQDRRVAVGMMTLLIAELGSIPGLIRMTLPNDVGNMCMKTITFRDIALFGVSAILPQLLVLGLTISKFFSGLRDGWGPIPIVSRLVRDDIILVAVIVIWVIISAALTSISTMYSYIGYAWLLSVIPSAGCRVVISMQRLAAMQVRPSSEGGQVRTESESPQLTSCLFVEYSAPYTSVQTFQLQTNIPHVSPSPSTSTSPAPPSPSDPTFPAAVPRFQTPRRIRTPLLDNNQRLSEFFTEVNSKPSSYLNSRLYTRNLLYASQNSQYN